MMDLGALYAVDPAQGVFSGISLVIIMGFYTWLCIDDIRKREVVFWKILLFGHLFILALEGYAWFCGCGILKIGAIAILPFWYLWIFINTKLNKETVVGKGDLDVLGLMLGIIALFCVWTFMTTDELYASLAILVGINPIVGAWLVGAILLLLVWVINIIVVKVKLKMSFKDIMKSKDKDVIEKRTAPAPALVMFWPPMLILALLMLTL